MKNIKWHHIFSLLLWLYKIVKEIIKIDNKSYGKFEYDLEKSGISVADERRHQVVKDIIVPYVKKKRWGLTHDDVDSIITGLVWFIKKIVKSKRG